MPDQNEIKKLNMLFRFLNDLSSQFLKKQRSVADENNRKLVIELYEVVEGLKKTVGGISFQVTPLDFNINNPLKFKIEIDTHSGSLDFNLTKISVLENESGNQYQPVEWEGSPPGGHHRSGTLSFPKINNQTKIIKLSIQDAYLRIFEWEL